ncbi:MAG TPA: type II CAAX endopeptidase family protein [Flavitalea sp.]|nr:type II CAAX endopeptidase family protein [Flavitalea sp.]
MIGYLRVKSPWSHLGIFLGLLGGGFIIGYLIMGIIAFSMGLQNATAMGKLDWSKPQVLSVMKVIQAVSSVLIFFLPSYIFGLIVYSGKTTNFLGFKPASIKPMYVLAIILILVSFPFVFWLGEINQLVSLPKWMGDMEQEATKQMQQFLKAGNMGEVILNVVIIALLPAICEEVCFRGALQRIMIHITKNAWTGIIITSILFSALHLQFQGFLPRMFLGIILGAIYWYSGSLWTSILAHFVNNALQVIVVSYAPAYIEKNPPVPVFLALLSGLLIVGLLWIFKSYSRVTYQKVYEEDELNRNNEFFA